VITSPQAQQSGKTTKLKGHMGKMILIVAQTYPQLIDFLLEVVQNAIDANPKCIKVSVDMKNRKVVITDDGKGVSEEIFNKALCQVGVTLKKGDEIGRFGRGLLSPAGKCREFTFTSCPVAGKQLYRKWTFVTADIEKQSEDIQIPVKEMPELQFCPDLSKKGRDKTPVAWRTRVVISDIIEDRSLTRISVEELESQIGAKFGQVIRKKGIVVQLGFVGADGENQERQVKVSDFQGSKLKEVEIFERDCGNTLFILYEAPLTKTGYSGKISFGERNNDFRITWLQLSYLIRATDLSNAEVLKALNSGIFEGEILSERCQIRPDRKGFEAGDAWIGFLATLEEWYEKYGKVVYEKIRQENREQRYQNLGTKAMLVIEKAIENQPDLKELLSKFSFGNIGAGHFPVPGIPQEGKALSTHGKHGILQKDRGGPSPAPKKEHKGHVPLTVAGPQGQQRIMVKGSSFGLCFVFSEMQTSLEAYEIDLATGVININIRHRYWFDCEVSDTKLTRYMEVIGLMVLGILPSRNYPQFEMIKKATDDVLGLLVFDITRGDAIAGRVHSKKS